MQTQQENKREINFLKEGDEYRLLELLDEEKDNVSEEV